MPTTRNPAAGLCSDITDEPLPGTAKRGRLVVAVEYPQGWGRDILDGDALGKELAGDVKRWLKRHGAELQFIRRPGRIGQQHDPDSTTVFIAHAAAETQTLERLVVSGGVRGLLDVDLSTPGAVPGATRMEHPLLLVCTHGKRDRCCAVKGRPLAAELAREYPDTVWESSHTKGHRFAPSMLLLPWNYSFGTLDAADATTMLRQATEGRLPVTGNRGRGTFDPQEQVAELAVAGVLADDGTPAGPGELTVEHRAADVPDTADTPAIPDVDPELRRRVGELLTERVELKATGRGRELKELKRSGYFQPVRDYADALRRASGRASGTDRRDTPVLTVRSAQRSWTVTLESQVCGPVVSSCGDRPKEGKAWVAVDVHEDRGTGGA